MKKVFLILVSVIICLSLFTGCGQSVSESSETDSAAEDAITIRYFGADSSALVKDYNYFSPQSEAAVILETQPAETSDDLNQQQYLELLTHQTADVYIFSYDYMGIFYSLLNSGLFLDLNSLVEQSDTIHLEDYESMVMDTGIKDSQRLFLPLSYRVEMFSITTQQLEEYRLQKDEIDLRYDNWEQTSELLLKAFPGESASLFSDSGTLFREMLSSKYLDEMEKRTDFLSDDFAKELESYYNYIEDQPERDSQTSAEELSALLDQDMPRHSPQQSSNQGENILFQQSFDGNAMDAASITRSFRRSEGQEARFFSIKDPSTGGYHAYANCLFAINKNCKNVSDAFAVAEFFLSEEYQRGDYFSNLDCHLGGLPVHIGAQEQMFEAAKREIMLQENQMPGLLEDYTEIVANVTSCGLFMDTRFMEKMFDPMFEEYCDGTLSTETFCNRLDAKATLFLMER